MKKKLLIILCCFIFGFNIGISAINIALKQEVSAYKNYINKVETMLHTENQEQTVNEIRELKNGR